MADLTEPLPIDGHGRRDPVDGDVPLDHRPCGVVPQPRLRCCVRAGSWSPNAAEPETSRRSSGSSPELGHTFGGGKTFATPEETRGPTGGGRLRRTSRRGCTTSPRRSRPEDLEAFLETVCLGGIVDGMADDERERFVHEVAVRMPEPRIDYVRLNIRARRAGLNRRRRARQCRPLTISPASALAPITGQHLPSEAPQPDERHGRGNDQGEDVERRPDRHRDRPADGVDVSHAVEQRVRRRTSRARFAITPTTAAVTVCSAAAMRRFPRSRSMYGAPRKIQRKHGANVAHVATIAPSIPAASGDRSPGCWYAPTNPTNSRTMMSGPGRGLGEAEADHHLPRQQPAVLDDRGDVHVRQHRVGAPERHQRRLAEEPTHVRQRVARSAPGRDRERWGPATPPDRRSARRRSAERRASCVRRRARRRGGPPVRSPRARARPRRRTSRARPGRRRGRSRPRRARSAGTARGGRRSRRTRRTATPTIRPFASAFFPIRMVADATIPITAAARPDNMALTQVTSPCTA